MGLRVFSGAAAVPPSKSALGGSVLGILALPCPLLRGAPARRGNRPVCGTPRSPRLSPRPHSVFSDSSSILAYFFPASVQWRLPGERKVSGPIPPQRHLSFLRCQASWLPSNLLSPLD